MSAFACDGCHHPVSRFTGMAVFTPWSIRYNRVEAARARELGFSPRRVGANDWDCGMAARSQTEWRAWLTNLAEETGAFTLSEAQAGSRVAIDARRAGADAVVTLRARQTKGIIKCAVVARSRINPREGMAAVSAWRTVRWDGALLLCCPYISPRVAEICRTAGVNYLDKAGNCRIVAGALYLEIAGHPNLAPDTRPLANPFSLKSSGIVRVLLENPDRSWQVQELAHEARVSLGLVSKSKQALVDEGFVRMDAGRVQLQDPEGLLRAWRAAYRPDVEPLDLYVMDDLPKAERVLASRCATADVRYALASFSAAWLLAPMVRVQRTTMLIEGSGDAAQTRELITAIGAKHVDSGANFTLWFTRDPSMLYGGRTVEGRPVTSPIQTYLDCVGKVGRGEEAAQAVFEQLIQPSFAKVRRTA